MSNGKFVSILLMACISSDLSAAQEVEQRPACPRAALAPANYDVIIVPVFEYEAYRQFQTAGFQVRSTAPNAGGRYLGIRFSAPTRQGFGGVCIERTGKALDLSRFHLMEVDIDAAASIHELQIKLERSDSSDADSQFRNHDGPLPRAGRQTLSFPLSGAAAVLSSVQRVCFAMEAAGFRAVPYQTSVKIHRVSFR